MSHIIARNKRFVNLFLLFSFIEKVFQKRKHIRPLFINLNNLHTIAFDNIVSLLAYVFLLRKKKINILDVDLSTN